ncbi:hypothetical protein SNEBB_004742 [Seison nebaliae]|nr:hypothetical protein SNEBB_004742 [Seison nebaliae]
MKIDSKKKKCGADATVEADKKNLKKTGQKHPLDRLIKETKDFENSLESELEDEKYYKLNKIISRNTVDEEIGDNNVKSFSEKTRRIIKNKKLKLANDLTTRYAMVTDDINLEGNDEFEMESLTEYGKVKESKERYERDKSDCVNQREIIHHNDLLTSEKKFQLKLTEFSPYQIDYTRNGRYLLLGGEKGHIASIDWQTKKLITEFQINERLHSIKWLNNENLYAIGQHRWLHIYDNQGIEIHCHKPIGQVVDMAYLPYHFLLNTINSNGCLHWYDVSLSTIVQHRSIPKMGYSSFTVNPSNGISVVGGKSGAVRMYSPNQKGELLSILCHHSSINQLCIDVNGRYLITTGNDRLMKVWDMRMNRNYKEVNSIRTISIINSLDISQENQIASSYDNRVQIFDNKIWNTGLNDNEFIKNDPHISQLHKLGPKEKIRNLKFCPYEDVLGIGNTSGFSSILAPASSHAHFDGLEVNPYQSKKHRQNGEVKNLLEKIPIDLITLNPREITEVNIKSALETYEENMKTLGKKQHKVDFTPKRRMKGRSKSGKIEKRKNEMKMKHRKEFLQKSDEAKKKLGIRN